MIVVRESKKNVITLDKSNLQAQQNTRSQVGGAGHHHPGGINAPLTIVVLSIIINIVIQKAVIDEIASEVNDVGKVVQVRHCGCQPGAGFTR